MALSGDLVPSTPAGGIAFTGCDMQSAAAAAADQPHGHGHAHPRRREVVVEAERLSPSTSTPIVRCPQPWPSSSIRSRRRAC